MQVGDGDKTSLEDASGVVNHRRGGLVLGWTRPDVGPGTAEARHGK